MKRAQPTSWYQIVAAEPSRSRYSSFFPWFFTIPLCKPNAHFSANDATDSEASDAYAAPRAIRAGLVKVVVSAGPVETQLMINMTSLKSLSAQSMTYPVIVSIHDTNTGAGRLSFVQSAVIHSVNPRCIDDPPHTMTVTMWSVAPHP